MFFPVLKFLTSEKITLPAISYMFNAAVSFCLQSYINETWSEDAFWTNDNELELEFKFDTLNNSVENFHVVKL